MRKAGVCSRGARGARVAAKPRVASAAVVGRSFFFSRFPGLFYAIFTGVRGVETRQMSRWSKLLSVSVVPQPPSHFGTWYSDTLELLPKRFKGW